LLLLSGNLAPKQSLSKLKLMLLLGLAAPNLQGAKEDESMSDVDGSSRDAAEAEASKHLHLLVLSGQILL